MEGLRAVAVLGVVLYHARVGLLGGGYSGVDVFFVISGYLITGLLWGELRTDGHLSLRGFYARRARRILPAAMVVIVATVVASRYLLPALSVPGVSRDGLASALYVGNYRFALEQTNYLNSAGVPSPFQHYWSLGVEEQFYLVWPLLLLAGSLVWRKPRGTRSRRPDLLVTILLLGTLSAASFAFCVWLTRVNQPWAFFSLPSRAWELGIGGLLALGAPLVEELPARLAPWVGWAGLGTIVGAYVGIGASTPFPGTAALAPVLGAAAVIAAGSASGSGPARFLAARPMGFLGRISYSWYLWHWPFMVLAPYAVGHPLGLGGDLLVALLSGMVAVLSFLLVETPVRASRWLSAAPRRSLLTGGAFSGGGALACLLVVASVPSPGGHGTAPVAVIRQTRVPLASPRVDPERSLIDSINSQINAQVADSLSVADVPANLQPSLTAAGRDDPPVFYDGCMDSYLDATVRTCEFGDVSSPTSVVLFGDSHAAMWFPAVDRAAVQEGWKLYNWTKATCPPLVLPIISPVLGRNFTECESWRQAVLTRIAQVRPALVILGVARHYTSIYGFTPYQQPWLTGMAQMVADITRLGSKVAVIGPVPKPPWNVPQCLSAHLTSATSCEQPEQSVVNLAGMAAEERAVRSEGGYYIDVLPWFCARGTCAAIVGNLEVWRDDNHIDATYSEFLGPAMSAELQAVISGQQP